MSEVAGALRAFGGHCHLVEREVPGELRPGVLDLVCEVEESVVCDGRRRSSSVGVCVWCGRCECSGECRDRGSV